MRIVRRRDAWLRICYHEHIRRIIRIDPLIYQFLGIIIFNCITVSRIHVDVCIFILAAGPFLDYPVLERQLILSFSCCRSFGGRICNCFCLIGILIWIVRRICAYDFISVSVFSNCGILNIDTIRAFKNLTPAGIQVYLAHSARILRIISRVSSISPI